MFHMMRPIGKFLFPRLPRDQQRQRMNNLIVILLVTLACGGAVVAMIYLVNKR
jgi:hypothetical protein